jgi:hypothetical protein
VGSQETTSTLLPVQKVDWHCQEDTPLMRICYKLEIYMSLKLMPRQCQLNSDSCNSVCARDFANRSALTATTAHILADIHSDS